MWWSTSLVSHNPTQVLWWYACLSSQPKPIRPIANPISRIPTECSKIKIQIKKLPTNQGTSRNQQGHAKELEVLLQSDSSTIAWIHGIKQKCSCLLSKCNSYQQPMLLVYFMNSPADFIKETGQKKYIDNNSAGPKKYKPVNSWFFQTMMELVEFN